MSLSPQVTDRLFDRLTTTYGRDFMGRWEGLDANAVKSSWAHELAGCAQCLDVIAWALENLPEKAPNVIEFRALCRRAPAKVVPALPAPPADPARVAAELAKLRATEQGGAGQSRVDGREWARAILRRVASGERLPPTVAAMAQGALGGVGVEVA